MTKIYEQHDAAFRQVSAFAILRNGEPVAHIAFKYPRDGAGRLYAYVHWLGVEMVRGYAGGYGYDKRSAAIENAVPKIPRFDFSEDAQARRIAGYPAAAMQLEISQNAENEKLDLFRAALSDIGGNNWDRALHDAGFRVFQVI